MAYDEGLAQRLRRILSTQHGIEEKKMFGGLCFLISGNMVCGIVGDRLMARVGAENYAESLTKTHVSEMDFTGKAMKGMVYIGSEGTAEDKELSFWVETCLQFVSTLPPKK